MLGLMYNWEQVERMKGSETSNSRRGSLGAEPTALGVGGMRVAVERLTGQQHAASGVSGRSSPASGLGVDGEGVAAVEEVSDELGGVGRQTYSV